MSKQNPIYRRHRLLRRRIVKSKRWLQRVRRHANKFERETLFPRFPALVVQLRTYARLLLRRRREPRIKFFILTMGRTGSTLLCDLLKSHPQIKCDHEILGYPVLFPRFFIASRSLSARKEIYCFKVLTPQIEQIQKIKDPRAMIHWMKNQGWLAIHLQRSNLVRHALSHIAVEQSQIVHRRLGGKSRPFQKVWVDTDRMWGLLMDLKRLQEKEKKMLEGIPCLSLTYEEHLLRPESHSQMMEEVSRFLGIPPAPLRSSYLRVTPSRLEDLVENYEEMVGFFEKTEFAEFLRDPSYLDEPLTEPALKSGRSFEPDSGQI